MQFKPFALLAAAAFAATIAAGCAKNSDQSSSTTTTTTSAATAAADAAHGKTIFTENCAGCHGATGKEGGVGPSLANEKSKKDYAATVAWIKDPKTTRMPKLYPAPLSEKDVDDVAAYVETL
jgi:mono/diheme cytochrome c family protein